MKKKIEEGLKKFVEASPSTKILFLFVVAIILAALTYCAFMIISVR